MLYEIRKMLSIKALLIWFIFLCAVSLIYPVYYTYNVNKACEQKYGDPDLEFEKIWEHYMGDGLEEAARLGHEEYMNRENGFCISPMSRYHSFLCKERARKTGRQQGLYFEWNMQAHSLKGIDDRLKISKNMTDYQYKNLIREKRMLENCRLEYSNTFFWEKFDLFETLTAMMIFLFVLFAVSGIYGLERSCNMRILLSTSPMPDIRIIRDKWFAGVALGTLSLILVNVILAAVFIGGGSPSGFDKSIVNLGSEFVYTPYDMTILEYAAVKLAVQIAAMLFMVSFLEYMSLVCEYRYQVILFGGLLFIPQLVAYLGVIGREMYKTADFLYDWSLLGGIYPNHLFYKYHTFNIFGTPVDFYTVYLIILMAAAAFLLHAIKKKYHRYIPEYSIRKI